MVMTDQELLKYSEEHVDYEFWMLNQTGKLLSTDPTIHVNPVVKNALIESFCVHARALAIFLYPEEAKELPGDVTSDQYVKAVAAWRAARGLIPPTLKEVIARTGKEVAHLTTSRKPFGASGKEWNPHLIVWMLIDPLKTFVAHVPAGRLYAPFAQAVADAEAARATPP
jgi:hypothetical protein